MLCNYTQIGNDKELPIIENFKNRHPDYEVTKHKTFPKEVGDTNITISFRCDSFVNEDGILEVKFAASKRTKKINENTIPHLIKINGEIKLKEDSKYYDQIQLYLYLTDRNICYFVIETDVDCFEEIISRNGKHIEKLLEKLRDYATGEYTYISVSKLLNTWWKNDVQKRIIITDAVQKNDSNNS